MKEELIKAIDDSLKEGWEMRKKTGESESGLFYYKPAHYEYRTAKNVKELLQLNEEGYGVTEDLGLLAVNILRTLHPSESPTN